MITMRRMLFGVLLIGSVACFQWLSKSAKTVDLDVRPVKASLLVTEGVREQPASQLGDEHWTEFTIHSFSRRIRVLANATIEPHEIVQGSPSENEGNPWRFSVEYQLLDHSGRVLKAGDYAFRSAILGQVNEETGAFEPRVFADAGRLIGTGSESMELASTFPFATGVRRVAVLRLREKSMPRNAAKIYVRVFDQMAAEHLEKVETWRQLSIVERNRICAESVYTGDLLSDAERQSMLRLRWVPAIKRNQFDTKNLFFRESQKQTDRPNETQTLSGTLVLPGRNRVFRIPDGPGHVTVSASRVEWEDDDEDASMDIQYQCADANDLLSFHRSLSLSKRDAFPVSGGLLVLRSQTNLRVQASWRESLRSDDPLSLLPDETTIRSVIVDDRPVHFDIHPTKYRDTLTRFVLRVPHVTPSDEEPSVIETSDKPATSTRDDLDEPSRDALRHVPQVRFQFLDQNDKVVGESIWECETAISAFDHCELQNKMAQVSEPAECYFSLSPNVSAVRVRCDDASVLVSCYVRPSGLPWKIDLRTEEAVVGRNDRAVARSWFSKNPREERALKAGQRICPIKLQDRPVDRNTEILAGRYQWHQFRPEGMWIGNEAMVSAEQQLGDPARSAMSLYYAIEPQRTYEFENFESQHVATSASERLICIAEDSVGTLTVYVNGQAWFARTVASRCATIDLPKSLPDVGTIRIRSDGGARVFMRGRVVHEAQRYYRRTLHALTNSSRTVQDSVTQRETDTGSGRLIFHYEKLSSAEEIVSVKFFASDSLPSLASHDRSLRLRIDGVPEQHSNESLPTWSIRSRVYRFANRFSDQSIVFDSGRSLSAPVQCVIKLGSDLPKGAYRLIVESPGVLEQGYVLVTQTVAGESPQRLLRHGN